MRDAETPAELRHLLDEDEPDDQELEDDELLDGEWLGEPDDGGEA
jgi:hypothetical protein